MSSSIPEVADCLLTIIMLNYNGTEDTINCIQSLKKHLPKGSPCEIVVVDNASLEHNYRDLQTSLDQDVTLLKSEVNAGFAAGNNIGISYALENTGLDVLPGDWISFVDADDWMHKQTFEILLSVALNNYSDIVCCEMSRTSEATLDEPVLTIDDNDIHHVTMDELEDTYILWTRVCGKLYNASNKEISSRRFDNSVK